MAGRIARGEVRLYSFAPPDKTRPVVVLTHETFIPHLTSITVAPIAPSMRGVPSEVALSEEDGMKSPCAVNLNGIITVPRQRLGQRVAQLSPARMREICAAVSFALGCLSEGAVTVGE